VGSCEHGSETLHPMRDREFLDQLHDCKLLKDCAPWSWLVSSVIESLVACSLLFYCWGCSSGFCPPGFHSHKVWETAP